MNVLVQSSTTLGAIFEPTVIPDGSPLPLAAMSDGAISGAVIGALRDRTSRPAVAAAPAILRDLGERDHAPADAVAPR